MPDAKNFLDSPTGLAWKRLGTQRRAGVATPLFSVLSKKSVGVGEIPDLKLLGDWCVRTGLSMIQLLPMNDTGFDFRPYDSQSSFALEPMHLSLEELAHVPLRRFASDIVVLRKKFPLNSFCFDTAVKKEKLELLRKMFDGRDSVGDKALEKYRREQAFWLESYTLFKCLKENLGHTAWESWPKPLRERNAAAIAQIKEENKDTLDFYAWMQWQLYLQFCETAADLRKKGVALMGDLPFLVSRDSADVWSCPEYFKLGLSSGAPPDLYLSEGQEWGMPPYDWTALEAGRYDYFIQKLQYAENFYDLYRIDHFVGLFRVWTFPREGANEERKRRGAFDPSDESRWNDQGQKVLKMILGATRLLPCAEDLGTVPECATRALAKYSIPGMDVHRWMREWGLNFEFKDPALYRMNSIVTLSTHDMAPFAAWWENEAGTVEKDLFVKKCHGRLDPYRALPQLFETDKEQNGRLRWKKEIQNTQDLLRVLQKREEEARDFIELYLSTVDEREQFWSAVGLEGEISLNCTPRLMKHALETSSSARSVFCVQLLQDWLGLGDLMGRPAPDKRINQPGILNEKNWRLRVPVFLEDMQKLPFNRQILALNKKTKRK